MSIIKVILILFGTLSLVIGVIGIIVPGLPTTPFLLLTAGLYVRSSDKLYSRLIRSRVIGSYIANLNKRKAMTIRSKLYAIISMWAMISMSCIFFIESLYVILAVSVLGIIGTIVMGFIVPTVRNK
jgi:uncharacterized membrane protein YbaN (DUF454 family)